MSDTRPSAFAPAPRRSRWGLLAVLIGLALLIGIALMVFAVQRSGGWFMRPSAAAQQPQQPVVDYNPAPPQSASGQSAAAAAVDPVMLATRESALAAQLAALEARTASVATDVAGASGQAGRAEAILIAFSARRAIDRGVGLGYLEEQIRARFGAVQPRATLIVIQSSRQPLTLEDLRQGLDANSADLISGVGGDILSALGTELRNLIVIHDAGTPSPRPADRLARARRMLDGGQVAAALAEVRRLPGASKAGAWIAAAGRYVDTRRALDTIESTAILGQAAATPPPPAPAAALPGAIEPMQ